MKGDSIPICRSIFNHWIYQDAEYLKVWVTMLGRAQYTPEPKTKIWKGITYTQHRGEFIFGRKQWNIDTGVSEDRLRRVIILLVKDNMIELVAFKGKFSMYKIINYEKFNQPRSKEVTGLGEDEPPTEPQQDPNAPPTEPQQTTTIKKVKKDKNVFTPEFETFMSAYPKQDEPNRAFTNWKSRLKEKVDPQTLIQAAKNYAETVKGNDQKFIKLASNFIGRDKTYLDYVTVGKSSAEKPKQTEFYTGPAPVNPFD